MAVDDAHTAIGAYALHALADDERARFRAHCAECPPCSQEADELSATAARLGIALRTGVPAGLKERLLNDIQGVRQDPPGRFRAGPGWCRGLGRFMGGPSRRRAPGHCPARSAWWRALVRRAGVY
ncbi:zf-HC2 domain-containing protein [Streptomyces sp. NPDC059398]|uniref:zf-HC2 domain-containing protein n=1 Tax=Streptomyces sp. NPDC059398 TaxID=3346820 RepID=UPI0036859908